MEERSHDNVIERLHEEFTRRIKTQTVLPSAETAAMLFWGYLLPGRSPCPRSMAGRRSSTGQPQSLTSPLNPLPSTRRRPLSVNFHHIRDGTTGDTRSGSLQNQRRYL